MCSTQNLLNKYFSHFLLNTVIGLWIVAAVVEGKVLRLYYTFNGRYSI